MIENKIKWKML